MIDPPLAQIPLAAYLLVGSVLFVTGITCMIAKRNLIGILIGIELVLNAGTVNLVAMSSPYVAGSSLPSLDGQIFALFVILLAAAEAAAALAIALTFYGGYATIDVDHGDRLNG
ncbi:MAG: hypothetical protein Kow0040_08170 [Thermogutta sp.]